MTECGLSDAFIGELRRKFCGNVECSYNGGNWGVLRFTLTEGLPHVLDIQFYDTIDIEDVPRVLGVAEQAFSKLRSLHNGI